MKTTNFLLLIMLINFSCKQIEYSEFLVDDYTKKNTKR